MGMKFTWDENKRILNVAKHGLDFVDAHQIFEFPTYTVEDNREGYGEQRFITLGCLFGFVVYLAHTENDEEIRCISFRSATRKEREIYFKQVSN
jgi:uncharacterized protein